MNKKKAQGEKQQAIDVRGRDVCNVHGTREHHVSSFVFAVDRFSFCLPSLRLPKHISGVHTRNMAVFFFGNYVYPSMVQKLSPGLATNCSAVCRQRRSLVCVCVCEIFQICPYTCSLCSAGDISRWLMRSIRLLFPNCLFALRLSYSVDSVVFFVFFFFLFAF